MAKIVVYHQTYGCESGCCGHVVELENGKERSEFEFVHPYGDDHRAFAEKMITDHFGEEHVADLDWENCLISED